MPKCETCRWWLRWPRQGNFGSCTSERAFSYDPDEKVYSANVGDGADVFTGLDFGCVHYQEARDAETTTG